MLNAVERIKKDIGVSSHILRTLNGMGVLAAITIIALA
jgi:hypothetical protein